ncbi:MAG TPA: alanine dehydrogenase [Kofleriaceae bacterium]|jgi:alanine dehydrogenase
MRIGVPKEIKTQEFRVGMTPSGVAMLTARKHEVLVEQGAGLGSSIPDENYIKAGAKIVATADEVWAADMVVKVKEPIAPEFARMRKDLLLFTYLHLAAAAELGKELLNRGVNGVAYETIEPSPGDLPLLTPMSAVAGRMSVQAGATFLERERGGKGVLLGGVPGVKRGRVTIVGGGVVGQNALKMAVGLGASVTVLDVNLKTLAYLDDIYGGRVTTRFSDPISIEQSVVESDLVVGAVLVAGARAPRLVTTEMIKKMEPGSVIVDVSIDQGGCVEGARATYHDNPTYDLHGVTAYMVANMPGAVPRTSTYALTNATIPYVVKLADHGLEKAIQNTPHIVTGLNTYKGTVPHAAVAEALNVPFAAYKA